MKKLICFIFSTMRMLFRYCPLPLVESIKPEKIDASTERVPSGDMRDKP